MKHNLNIVTENGGYMLVVIDPITASVVTARPFDYALLDQRIADEVVALEAALAAIIGPEEPIQTNAEPPVLVGSTKDGYPIYGFSIASNGFDPTEVKFRLMYRLELVKISDSIESINLHTGSSLASLSNATAGTYTASSTAAYFRVENNAEIDIPPSLVALRLDGSVSELPNQYAYIEPNESAIAVSATKEYIVIKTDDEVGNIDSLYGVAGSAWKRLVQLESANSYLGISDVQTLLAATGVDPEYIQAVFWCSNSYGYFELFDGILYRAYDDFEGVDLTPIISDVAGEGYTTVATTFYTADTLPLVYFWQNFEKAAEQP